MSTERPGSFEETLIQYTPMIHHIINKLHIYQDFEDYIQIGRIALWNAYEKFDEQKGSFSGYAFLVMKGHILLHLKKQRKYADSTAPLEEAMLEVIAGEDNTALLEKETLALYIEPLTPREKTYVIERLINRHPLDYLCDKYGVSTNTVKAWGKSARRKLKERLLLLSQSD